MAMQTDTDTNKSATVLDGPLVMDKKKKGQLRDFVRRAETLQKEAEALSEDRSSLDEEIEEAGLDKKMIKRVVKARQLTRAERDADQEKFEFYMTVVGEEPH